MPNPHNMTPLIRPFCLGNNLQLHEMAGTYAKPVGIPNPIEISMINIHILVDKVRRNMHSVRMIIPTVSPNLGPNLRSMIVPIGLRNSMIIDLRGRKNERILGVTDGLSFLRYELQYKDTQPHT